MKYAIFSLIFGINIFGFSQEADYDTGKSEITKFYQKQYTKSFNEGDNLAALTALDSALIYAKLEVPDDYVIRTELEYSKGNFLLKIGDTEGAINYTAGILDEYHSGKRENAYGEGRFLLLEANIKIQATDFEEVIKISKSAIPKIDNYIYKNLAYSILSQAFAGLNQIDSATYYAAKGIETLELNELTDSYEYIIMSVNLTYLLAKKGECASVLETAEEIIIKTELYDSTIGLDAITVANTYLAVCYAHGICKNYDKAILYAELARERLETVAETSYVYTYCLDVLIELNLKIENYEEALLINKTLIPIRKANIINQSSLLPAAEKDLYLNRKRNSQSQIIAILEMIDNDTDFNWLAYSYVVFLKGFPLKSLLNLQTKINALDDEDVTQSFEYWLQLRDEYYQNLRFPVKQKTVLDSLKIQLDVLESTFYEKTRKKQQGEVYEDIKFNEIKRQVDPGDLVVEFVRYWNVLGKREWRYGAFVFHAESLFPAYISICSENDLEQVLKRQEFESEFKYINRLYGEESNLYRLIWGPILDQYSARNKLYVSSVGLLHGISFDAIVTPQNEMLSNSKEIILLNSTAELSAVKKKQSELEGYSNIMLFGGIDYTLDSNQIVLWLDSNGIANSDRTAKVGVWKKLKNSQIEVNQIGEMVQNKDESALIYEGHAASEITFKQAVEKIKPEIIHIATHGYFVDDTVNTLRTDQMANYTESGLVMAGANNCFELQSNIPGYGDGILTAPEISSLNLSDTKLVVLSACESGSGNTNNIGNIYGLQRAFKIAGADYIIYTIWKVSDEVTMKFMKLFYQKLMVNGNISTSFHEIKQEMKKNYSPFYWASFQLIY